VILPRPTSTKQPIILLTILYKKRFASISITKSSPLGVLDDPFNPTSLALGAGATFVGRGHDKDRQTLQYLLERAASHKGTSFLELYTNCRIFNDGAFEEFTNKDSRDETTIWLEDGKPLIFGKDRNKGIILDGYTPKVVSLENGSYSVDDLLVHNEKDSTLALILSDMSFNPELPRPMGVFQSIEKSSYDERVEDQIKYEIETKGEGNLEELLLGESFWEIK